MIFCDFVEFVKVKNLKKLGICGGFGVIFVAKQNKNHDKTGGNRKVIFFKIKVDKIHKLLA